MLEILLIIILSPLALFAAIISLALIYVLVKAIT